MKQSGDRTKAGAAVVPRLADEVNVTSLDLISPLVDETTISAEVGKDRHYRATIRWHKGISGEAEGEGSVLAQERAPWRAMLLAAFALRGKTKRACRGGRARVGAMAAVNVIIKRGDDEDAAGSVRGSNGNDAWQEVGRAVVEPDVLAQALPRSQAEKGGKRRCRRRRHDITLQAQAKETVQKTVDLLNDGEGQPRAFKRGRERPAGSTDRPRLSSS